MELRHCLSHGRLLCGHDTAGGNQCDGCRGRSATHCDGTRSGQEIVGRNVRSSLPRLDSSRCLLPDRRRINAGFAAADELAASGVHGTEKRGNGAAVSDSCVAGSLQRRDWSDAGGAEWVPAIWGTGRRRSAGAAVDRYAGAAAGAFAGNRCRCLGHPGRRGPQCRHPDPAGSAVTAIPNRSWCFAKSATTVAAGSSDCSGNGAAEDRSAGGSVCQFIPR